MLRQSGRAGLGGLMMSFAVAAWAGDLQDVHARLSAGCWVCDGFAVIGDVGLDTAQRIFTAVSADAALLAGLLLALWGLVLAARTFLPFGIDKNLWNEGAARLLGFALLFCFLAGGEAFWDDVFVPIIATGVAISVRLFSALLPQSCPVAPFQAGLEGARQAMQSMDCPLAAVQDVFARGILTGLAMIIGAGLQSWLDLFAFWNWPARILQILAGEGLLAVYLFGFLLFPFFFIDALLRAVLIAMLAPAAILCWLFKATRRIAEKSLRGLWLSALTLVFSSVATGLVTTMLRRSFATIAIAPAPGAGGDDWSALIARLQSGDATLSLGDQAFWALLGIGIIAIFLIRGAQSMAAAFAGASAGEFSGGKSAGAVMAGAGAFVLGRAAANVQRAGEVSGRPSRRREGAVLREKDGDSPKKVLKGR